MGASCFGISGKKSSSQKKEPDFMRLKSSVLSNAFIPMELSTGNKYAQL
jgi:hypothetical protein